MTVQLLFILLLFFPITSVSAATLKSPGNSGLILETNVTAPPTPIPLQAIEKNEFRLKVSSDLIDFGPLTATNPSLRHLTLSVDPGYTSYSLLAFENHPLSSPDGDIISDTTCDDGACTDKTASVWINPFTFGFGFSLYEKEYRQFPDAQAREQAISLPEGKLTLKLNINQSQQTQANKAYENKLIFLLIPKF